MKTHVPDAKSTKPTFEEALAELEAIVGQMESGELPLEESMKRFERGMALAKFCTGKLAETEKKIEMLMKNADGEAQWQELPGLETPAGKDS